MISASDWRYHALAPSGTWRSKFLLPPAWCRIWKRERWIRPLFGRIYAPSIGDDFVAQWTDLLAAIRASRSASPASSAGSMIPGISGPCSERVSLSASRPGACSRTSPTILTSASMSSPASFKSWITTLRRHCLQRRKLARHTSANGCSSWPTAKVSTGDYSYSSGDHTRPVLNLEGAAKLWSTPSASEGFGRRKSDRDKSRNDGIETQAKRMSAWSTPTTRDHKDGASPSPAAPTNSLLGRQAPRMMQPGPPSSRTSPTSRLQLNPRFVEWLMGWSLGWTDFAFSETASSHSKPPLRSAA